MLDIRQLAGRDVDDAMALSTQAGWNQVAADWERLLALDPDGCFAGTVDGELVATTTVVTYDDQVSWIGMVLVDESHRGQGFGTRMFERGLEYAKAHGGSVVGLDATDLGEPIYGNYDFQRVAPVVRWNGRLDFGAAGDGTAGPDDLESDDFEPIAEEIPDAVLRFDREQVGVDRTGLLRELISEPEVTGVVSRSPSGIDGYAIVRPGRHHSQVGPVVATDPGRIEALFRALSRRTVAADVIVDAPKRPAIDAQLERIGLTPARELVRMTYPDPEPALLGDSVCGFVDFAFG